jgi:hypothetical protein
LITPEQEEKIFKFTSMIIFPKLISNSYPKTSTPPTTSSKDEIFVNFIPIINKNIKRSIKIIQDLFILYPNIIFQLTKYNREKEIIIIIDRQICSLITKYKFDNKSDESQKQIRVIFVILDWFSNKEEFVEEETIIIVYMAKYNITILNSYKKIINNPKYIK